MRPVRAHTIGFVFGAFMAIWHILWSLLVAAGVAQAVLDLIFRLHMITPPYRVAEFNLGTAAGLVFVTAAVGYVGGLAMGAIWNRCIPREASV